MLGVTIANSAIQNGSQYDNVISKMEAVINIWINRQMPLMGKVLLINTLMGSLSVHKMYVLPELTPHQLTKIYKLIDRFLWKGKQAKIPNYILRRNKKLGGLKLVDFEIKYQTLQFMWVKRIAIDTKYTYVYDYFKVSMGKDFWYCNLHPKDIKKLCKGWNFWHQLRLLWAKLQFHEPQNGMEVKNQIIWYNSCIKQNGNFLEPVYNLRSKGLT